MTPPRADVARRSLPALAAALTRAWWPQVAALAAAAAVVAATITGALGVGSALRRGLRDLALERLGGIEAALVAEDFVRADLADELAGMRLGGDFDHALVPAIVADVIVETAAALPGPRGRAPLRAGLLACDDPAELGFAGAAPPADGEVLVNGPLAAALGMRAGDPIVVRMPPRSAVPADSPLGRRSGLAAGSRLTVAGVLPEAGLGRFALAPAAATRPLVVMRLGTAWPLVRRDGVANVIFAAGGEADSWRDRAQRLVNRATARGHASLSALFEDAPASPAAANFLRAALDPRPADLGLAVESVADGRATRLTSRRLILPAEVDRAAAAVLGPLGGRPTLAFLATSLEPVDGDRTAVIPYSTVLGIDATALPVGDLVDDAGRPLGVPADDEILIDRWMADDLAAQGRPVAVGDRMTVRYFRPETLHGRVEEATVELRVAGIAAMRGAAVARDLVPDVEGVTDEASIADWDPPFPFDRERIRSTPPHDEDERYWQAHGVTPKAFVSLATARRLAGSRFGATTAWFVPAAAADRDALADRITAAVDPAAVGIRVVPLRAEALRAARGSTPFGGLFLALSSFVVAAGLALEWLLFELLVAARRRDVGVLAAVGWPPARIARLLLVIGGAAAVGGAALGALLGPAVARTLMASLAAAWSGAVDPGAAAAFARWPAVADIWPGAVAAAVVSLAALAWAARRAARTSPAALLAGRDDVSASTARGGMRSCAVAVALLAGAAACAVAGRGADAAAAVGLFFAAGAAALGGCLSLTWWWLGRRAAGVARSLPRLARRGLTHRRGRAFAVAASVAVAEFLVVAVSAFRLAAPSQLADRDSPAGGWTHMVAFGAPVSVDPGDPAARATLGLDAEEERVLAACDVALLRSSGGADANCTNLYDAAGRAAILGVGPGFVARGGFRFTATARPVENPWTLLDRPAGATGPVPAILDAATAQWALKLGGVGVRFTLPDEAGRPVELEIVGLLDLSILQGFVIVAEREFERMYSARSGYGLALVDGGRATAAGAAPAAVARAAAAAWADAAPEVTAAAERIARLQGVQNTFLGAFQALGALGLLLGTAGVAAVQAQGVVERRGQLALLRAVGFTPARLRGLLVLETLWTVGLGLAAGTAAGLLAVMPLVAGGGAPLGWIAATGGLVLAVAAVASFVGASRRAIPDRPRAE
jgi:hypothetical protein